jgi:hypothetical protein
VLDLSGELTCALWGTPDFSQAATNTDRASEVLARLVKTMRRREATAGARSGGQATARHEQDGQPVMLHVSTRDGDRLGPDAVSMLTEVQQRGPAVGIHPVIYTPDPAPQWPNIYHRPIARGWRRFDYTLTCPNIGHSLLADRWGHQQQVHLAMGPTPPTPPGWSESVIWAAVLAGLRLSEMDEADPADGNAVAGWELLAGLLRQPPRSTTSH